jgi:3-deoxy-7-phosphoheptulonate synthase
MTDKRIEDLNIISCSRLITPEEFKSELPASELATASVIRGRETVKNILARKDKRLFVVIGPCSIHDPVAAMDYGKRLAGKA